MRNIFRHAAVRVLIAFACAAPLQATAADFAPTPAVQIAQAAPKPTQETEQTDQVEADPEDDVLPVQPGQEIGYGDDEDEALSPEDIEALSRAGAQ